MGDGSKPLQRPVKIFEALEAHSLAPKKGENRIENDRFCIVVAQSACRWAAMAPIVQCLSVALGVRHVLASFRPVIL